MKCPLLTAAHIIAGSFKAGRKCECGQAECAWGDAASEWCILKTAAHEVHALRVVLQEIKNKMPHADQFTK